MLINKLMVLDENRRNEIIRTIQQMRSQGATKTEIKNTLSQMGLTDEEIETLMEKAEVDVILSAKAELQRMVDEKLNQELPRLRDELLHEIDVKTEEKKNVILGEFDRRLANLQDALEKRFAGIIDNLRKKEDEIATLEKQIRDIRADLVAISLTSPRIRMVISYTFLFIGLAVLMYVFYQYYVTGQWLSLLPAEFTENPDTALLSLGYLFGGIVISSVLFVVSQYIKGERR
jgi:DNA-binding transcriptional MerR regulator